MTKTVIKFWAGYCGPCNQYAPTFTKVRNELQEELGDTINFIEIDVENDPENMSAEYGVRGIPHTTVLVDGVRLKDIPGNLPESVLRDFILN
jgi:thioredoxin 1